MQHKTQVDNEIADEKFRKKIILAVYFSGSGHELSYDCLAGSLWQAASSNSSQIKMGFKGCGIDYGWKGTIFGTGLEEQCGEVVEQVKKLLSNGQNVTVNAYGHSRGGIACLLLAKMLGDYSSDLVTVNLVLMDPVPGNLIISSKLDFAGLTLAKQSMDLSKCRNLNAVLAIYTQEPLPALSFHAPIIPTYPATTNLDEHIIPGCHSGAQYTDFNEESRITSWLVYNFLHKHGTRGFPRYLREITEGSILDDFNIIKQRNIDTGKALRPCHSYRTAIIKTNYARAHLSPLHHSLDNNDEIQPLVKPAFSFKGSHFSKRKPSIFIASNVIDQRQLVLSLLGHVLKTGLSAQSKNTKKGELLQTMFDSLSNQITSVEDESILKQTLRNIIALCLQRDRYACSLFNRTCSGKYIVTLLNTPEMLELKTLLIGDPSTKLQYQDLCAFVQGNNNTKAFNAKYSNNMYQLFESANTQNQVFVDHTNYYVRSL